MMVLFPFAQIHPRSGIRQRPQPSFAGRFFMAYHMFRRISAKAWLNLLGGPSALVLNLHETPPQASTPSDSDSPSSLGDFFCLTLLDGNTSTRRPLWAS